MQLFDSEEEGMPREPQVWALPIIVTSLYNSLSLSLLSMLTLEKQVLVI